MIPFLQKAGAAWREFRQPSEKSLANLAGALSGGGGGEPAGGVTAHGSGVWVHACVSLIGRTLAAAPFRVSQRGRVLKAGPVVDLFEQPHPRLSRVDLWELVAAWLMLRGRAYLVGLDGAGFVVELHGAGARRPPRHLLLLNADRVRPECRNGELLGYKHTPGHDDPFRETYLLPEEVIALRLPSPFDFTGGQSPAAVAALAAQTDQAAALFMRGLMLNNGDTGVIVETDQQPTPEQREQILGALRERKRSAGTADRPLLLWGGFKVVKPELSSADLQFLESRKFARQEICAVFGVPQELLGFTEDANRSVGQSARANFAENTITPLAERIAAAVQPLVRLFGNDLKGAFDVGSLPALRTAQRERFAVAKTAQLMGVPLRVVNQAFALGLPALPGDGDAVRPFGVNVAGTMAAKPAPAAEPPAENAFLRLAAHLSQRQNAPGAKSPHGHSTLGAPNAARTVSDVLQAGLTADHTPILAARTLDGPTAAMRHGADYSGPESVAADLSSPA